MSDAKSNKDDDGSSSDWLASSDDEDAGLGARDASKVERIMYDEGYREGISAGKESMIQVGFDQGYTTQGAPIGRRMGNLCGTMHVLQIQCNKGQLPDKEQDIKELQRRVFGLQMKDVVEPDWEAIEHEREHEGERANVQRETQKQKQKREELIETLQSEADKLLAARHPV